MDYAGKLAAEGIHVHLVTCEPDPVGDEAMLAKLLSRIEGRPPLLPPSMKLSADPERKLIVTEAADIYVSRVHREGWTMVQPTLVVLDSNGKVVPECSWSWKTMGIAPDQDYAPGPQGIKMTIMARPDVTDWAAAIRERRAIKLREI